MYNRLGYFSGKMRKESPSYPVTENCKKLNLLFNCSTLLLSCCSSGNGQSMWSNCKWWGFDMLDNDYPWARRVCQSYSDPKYFPTRRSNRAKEPDNWGKFLFFNWMQGIIVLNVGKTFNKWIASVYLSLCLFPFQETLLFLNFREERKASVGMALVKLEMCGSGMFTPILFFFFNVISLLSTHCNTDFS